MRLDRRSALIGSATMALSAGASRAFAQQGLAQAPANAIAAQRAEHAKLDAPAAVAAFNPEHRTRRKIEARRTAEQAVRVHKSAVLK